MRTLPEGHSLQRLCDANTYSTMITLCGPWQQLRRALQLVAEMRSRSLECGIQVPPITCAIEAQALRITHDTCWPDASVKRSIIIGLHCLSRTS